MSPELLAEVDNWFADLLVGQDDALDHALAASAKAGLPAINVSPAMGKFLHILAKVSAGARRILEIGTLGGYSSIWLARALPAEGRLITLEVDPDTASIARSNLEYAGLDHVVEVRTGSALDTLPKLATEELPPFDLVFIDADKKSTPEYFDYALRLTRPGGMIVIDNVVREGRVIDRDNPDPDIQGIRRVTEMIAAEPRVTATVMQTVGVKRYDGFLIALVLPS